MNINLHTLYSLTLNKLYNSNLPYGYDKNI